MLDSTTAPAPRPQPWSLALCLLAFSSTAMAQMPYSPTRVLQNDNRLYIFQPSSQSPNQFELGSIDVSSRIQAASLPYTTLNPTLPFLSNDTPRAFTPLLAGGGNITVYAGDCSRGAAGGTLWNFAPDASKQAGKGNWKQQDVSVKDSTHTAIMGPNYLSGGMTFSSTVGGGAASTGSYFFGGMCPSAGKASDGWQSAGNYSNLMVTIQPPSSGTKYTLDISSARGPPVPEAGFAITALEPTFTNRSDGSQTQQQNFLLIGGHTSKAFINMSQVALFSLPEQGWTFITVKTSKTIQDLGSIDPRSGHSAVLTPDGQRIIILGGWVGDINTPAEPQLLVLNVADGYGGKGEWLWDTPSTSGLGLPKNSGIYGHGAAMLPGGVLMITGGYSIQPSASRRKRSTPSINTKAYFYNTTSNAWVTEYSPPSGVSRMEPINNGPLSSPGQKAGLGVGLGIGVAAVCGLFAFYMWYTRRLKKQREIREKQIHDLSFTAHRYTLDTYSPGFDGRGGQADGFDYLSGQNGNYYFPPGTQGGQGWRQTSGRDAERTGLLVEIPSPTRGLRRSLSGRPGIAMGNMRGAGHIHPIDELEEDQEEERVTDRSPLNQGQEMETRPADQMTSPLHNAPVLDPFTDTHRRGESSTMFHTAQSSPVHEEVTQVEYTHHRATSSISGRLSPDKSTSADDRTSSNLSDRSTRSGLSWVSSSAGVVRSASMRSAAILNNAIQSNPFRTPHGSPTREEHDSHSDDGRYSPVEPRTQSFTSTRSNGYAELDSFRTAQSSFAHLQAEGEILLGGNPEKARPGTSSSNSNTYHDTEGSYSRAATATPATSFALDPSNISRPATRERRRSWLGSVRRVLTRSISGAERTRSLTTTMTQTERYTDEPSPIIDSSKADQRKSMPASTSASAPRRAASDASFWRSRRGQQDWLEDEQDSTWKRTAGDDWGAPEDVALAERERLRQEWRERGNLLVSIDADHEQLPTPRTPIRSDQLGVPNFGERPGTPASEADWDVEAAVERRVVQVMFTVPKSKLRVVNADMDRNSLLSREDSAEDVTDERSSSPSRVKDLASRFEQLESPRMSNRPSPSPSPSPSIKSMKVRSKGSSASLSKQTTRRSSGQSPLAKGKSSAGL